MDFAAAIQEALESLMLHVLAHYRESTGLRNLCLAGGVSQNCSANGKILYSHLFDQVFVQPAAHDAGCALGAALFVSGETATRPEQEQIRHVFWGSDIGDASDIEKELHAWRGFLEFEKCTSIEDRTASLIAQGSVIGWVQGRTEFGPRALGNRSILADPRPVQNKDRINQMVKKRESFRPFAPSVLDKDADQYFEIPQDVESLPFMTFVVKVRPEWRPILGAVTHVDGTARLQTVSFHDNPRYWNLIQAFGRITGVPILLNTCPSPKSRMRLK
jgi:carbamoyltransferase